MKKVLLLFTCAFCLSLACSKGISEPLPTDQLKAFQNCEKDDDCIFANNGCCDCANGGQAVAVNKQKLEEFKKTFDCTNRSCTLIGAIPPCNQGKATCENKLCQYKR